MAEPTVFTGLYFVFFYSQNVAVSKSRHRLLFHPTGKEKSTEKIIFRDFEYGGQIIEREGVSTFSIHGFPWALRYLLIFLKLFVCFSTVGLKKFL